MMLAGITLRQNLLSPNAIPKRASTIDLTVGTIVATPAGQPQQLITEGTYQIAPSEMITIISAENFNLPQHITAMVMPKSSTYSKGLLTLGIGIVDPGWDGPISTILINFGKSPQLVRIHDPILRVAFFCAPRHNATQQKST